MTERRAPVISLEFCRLLKEEKEKNLKILEQSVLEARKALQDAMLSLARYRTYKPIPLNLCPYCLQHFTAEWACPICQDQLHKEQENDHV